MQVLAFEAFHMLTHGVNFYGDGDLFEGGAKVAELAPVEIGGDLEWRSEWRSVEIWMEIGGDLDGDPEELGWRSGWRSGEICLVAAASTSNQRQSMAH